MVSKSLTRLVNIDSSRNNILFISPHFHSMKVSCFFLWYYSLMLQKKKKKKEREKNCYESHCQMLEADVSKTVSDLFLNCCISHSFLCCLLIFVELENRLSIRQDDLLTSNCEALLWKLLSWGWILMYGLLLGSETQGKAHLENKLPQSHKCK